MVPQNDKKQASCPVETTLRVLGGRWKVLVLRELLVDMHRFNELERKLAGISNRTLTRQLRELEADGIVDRRVFGEVPPRVEYRLTPLGRSLEPILKAMSDWGTRHGESGASPSDAGAGPS